MIRIPVTAASRSYEVLVNRGLLREAGQVVDQVAPGCTRICVVTSKPIRKLWGKTLAKGLHGISGKVRFLEMPDGERAKRLSNLEKLAEELVGQGADRQSVIVALGGGVVGDVAGFLASVFMRGIPVIQVPSTLVAQVDSAIGGKTGVNLSNGKNLLGTFHQPACVLVDPDVLSTLPQREYRSGLFEAMKYGVIRKPDIFALMENHRDALLARDGDLLEQLITDCIQVKAEVVSSDERESGERRILNFGHTIGHALEAETAYKSLLHGEAVGWGMIAAASIGEEAGVSDKETSRRIKDMVIAYGPLPKLKVKPSRILKRLMSDKKTVGGTPHFVLARRVGEVEIANDVPKPVILHAVEKLNELSSRKW